ncbi:kinase-like domain-containing protein [Phellopilus nigrolimitatus]|nr:kinase-like domain-containing protein [Phellopilus nigrolimitatus]
MPRRLQLQQQQQQQQQRQQLRRNMSRWAILRWRIRPRRRAERRCDANDCFSASNACPPYRAPTIRQWRTATTTVNADGSPEAPLKSSTSIRTQKWHSSKHALGDYTLGKTLYAGSMGKVKLVYDILTGEKVRSSDSVTSSIARDQDPHADQYRENRDERRRADRRGGDEANLEGGIEGDAGEAAPSMLLHHPYICGMRELIAHMNHCYVVFEYVNGGRCSTTSSATVVFASAVVHRDLKVENVLTSQTSNIKIIDLVFPTCHPSLHFCGSLCFTAPELLNSKVLAEPRATSGASVSLYVLVCVKMPFDNQSMPALHAEIECGLVECPDWLSAECKHLLIRILIVNSSARAILAEILSHPWMIYELDRQVIQGMAGFEFGYEDGSERKLVDVLKSSAFARAVQPGRRNGLGGLFNASLACCDSSLSAGSDFGRVCDTPTATPSKKSRHFSGFDFYWRNDVELASLVDMQSESADPTGSFHPLLPMYFLAP